MGAIGNRSQVFLLVLLLVISLDPGTLGDGPDGDDRAIGPFAEEEGPWTDSLDDMSHVYVPSGGLVGVEVSGGLARLKTGVDDGWIASSVISPPAGYRYDTVVLELVTPGASYVQLSMLNASADPTEVGFANDTIPNFRLVDRDEDDHHLSVYSIGPAMYPEVRIQVTFHGFGINRPRLLSWSLEFVDVETWRDSFWGTDRMEKHRGLNLTDGGLEVNLSSRTGSSGVGLYEPYPTIVAAEYMNNYLCIYYPNAARDGYQDCILEDSVATWYNDFADFDNDGDMDLVSAPYQVGKAQIFWTGSDGRLSLTGTTDWDSGNYRAVQPGDFNNDGWQDIFMSGPNGAQVFLNKGEGVFSTDGDITLAGYASSACAGDFNNDGIEDIFTGTSSGPSSSTIKCYFGGPSGPDTVADIEFTGDSTGMTAGDLNDDGFLDLLLKGDYYSNASVYLGGPEGPDGTVDHIIENSMGSSCGDLNGDGYWEIVHHRYTSGNHKLIIHVGSASGWTSSNIREVAVPSGSGELSIADMNVDGYDDLVYTCWDVGPMSYTLRIFLGGSSWPTTHTIYKEGEAYNSHAIAIPRGVGSLGYMGRFTTNAIDLPVAQGKRWDIVHLEGTMPQNTSMRLSVLDEEGEEISGYEDLADWTVDISGLNPFLHRTIKVRVTIQSEFNNTTPALDSLIVKWRDKMTWRDEFYGPVRVEGQLHMGVAGGAMGVTPPGGAGPQLLFTSIRDDTSYNTTPMTFFDAGGLDYLSRPPDVLGTRGTSAVDVADVNGDGYLDVALAVHRTADDGFHAKSPIYLGSAIGMRSTPFHECPTTGASDVLLEDLNSDGYMDVVFAQEQDTGDYLINSTLFWGSSSGWNTTPDAEFATTGASGVDAADMDGDGLADLVFSCFRAASTATDSMVFLQTSTGFNGTSPSHRLPTKGARAVATGDLNGDSLVDVVFANMFSGGLSEIDSHVYWGKAGGGFQAAPDGLPTKGAQDVAVADMDGDGDLDIVFANQLDNSGSYDVPSYVYLNDGSGGFASVPDRTLPTNGACSVTVADIDGTGWKDLVFACERNVITMGVPSMVFLGGASGWGGVPDILLPTVGATDVAAAHLVEYGAGAYLSTVIRPEDPENTGAFHTFRYTADMGASLSGELQLVDAITWEMLAGTSLMSGTHEWEVRDLVKVKAHPSVRVCVVLSGLESGGAFDLDDLWLNWTVRVKRAPEVVGMEPEATSLHRMEETVLWVDARDEYDLTRELIVTVQHRLNGTTGPWEAHMLGNLQYDQGEGRWKVVVRPRSSAPVGVYDLRASVRDRDIMTSAWVEFPQLIEVLNNVPTAPEVAISPARARTTSTLEAEIVTPATDVEATPLTYLYRWFRDGEPVENATGKTLPSFYTRRGQNWSVEVRAFDGVDQGPPAFAWRLIDNTPPQIKNDLPDPEIDEDTTDTNWLDLSQGFEDPDGDALMWRVEYESDNLEVTIDPLTGQVTLEPAANWFGEVTLTFTASDGEFNASQTVTVNVVSVNDVPTIATVDGEPVTGDTLEYTILQGEELVITYIVADVEGDEVVGLVDSSAVVHDGEARTITYVPGDDDIGTLTFTLRIYDVESPNVKVSLTFVVTVENRNDPMDDPRITNPAWGETYKVNESVTLIAVCTDPDTPFGQVLTFTWESNISGVLGHGSSLTLKFLEPGTHLVTLTVTDGEFSKTDTIELVIEPRSLPPPPPPPNGGGEEEDLGWVPYAALVAVLVVIGAVLYIITTRRRTEEAEAADEAEYRREHMERAREAVKEAADRLEAEPEPEEAPPVEVEEVLEEVATGAAPDGQLSMQATMTEAPSAETAKLFAGISTAESEQSEKEREALRIENLKRKYQNAIGRLPYGIPSKELADRDWVDLAAALATGEKKETPGGREVTEIEGRWYYSTASDSGTFLKEYGAKPKREEPKMREDEAAAAPDKDELLAKLEERFILGEISEDAYNELKRKYWG